MTEIALRKMASISSAATASLEEIIYAILSITPSTLGLLESTYYPGDNQITTDEIAAVARVMEKHDLEPENTRVRKSKDGDKIVYDILQASAQTNTMLETRLKGSAIPIKVLQQSSGGKRIDDATIQLVRGDHSHEMLKICGHLTKAIRYSANDTQTCYLMDYLESFTTGSLEAYRRSMKHWVEDQNPRVESIFGFVEPYRDPYGVRCEWRGVVSIADPTETAKLATLVNSSTKFIQMLPWAVPNVNNGKGPFEKTEFQPPHFSIVHGQSLSLEYLKLRF